MGLVLAAEHQVVLMEVQLRDVLVTPLIRVTLRVMDAPSASVMWNVYLALVIRPTRATPIVRAMLNASKSLAAAIPAYATQHLAATAIVSATLSAVRRVVVPVGLTPTAAWVSYS
jgi:hypothetical protein